MSYAYFNAGRTNDKAVFDLFFRKNPFSGEYTIFAGLAECLKYLQNFKFTECDIDYLRTALPTGVDEKFFDYLRIALLALTLFPIRFASAFLCFLLSYLVGVAIF